MNILRSKTVWLGIIVALLSVAQGFLFQIPVQPAVQAAIGGVIAVAIVVLRFMTTQPVSDK
jgi:hypothetical protein|tara:strand:- start:256 stop:438 length:183 start_codon:yes stop_codon:yes gene_type:complete